MMKIKCLLLLLLCCYKIVMAQETTSTVETQEVVVRWVKEVDSAEWKPRDSSGELVFKNKLWIMGGWHNSFEAPPRDVWSSSDGVRWQQVTAEAPWKHSDFPMTVVFKNKMWVMGGWYNGRLPGHSASNKVWSSTDGKEWKKVTDSSAWSPRIGAAVVNFKGKLWLLGGTENYYFGDSTSLKNDVWCSSNGKEWKLVTQTAAWAPRAYHSAVVFNNKIWVMGGGNYVPEYKAYNDIWYSENGVDWIRVNDTVPWSPRLWFSTIVHQNHMWVLGGWSNFPSKNWNDVWYSKNGIEWKLLKADTIWQPRHEHSTYVFKNKIWVAGGNTSPLVNDVWSLTLPQYWHPN